MYCNMLMHFFILMILCIQKCHKSLLFSKLEIQGFEAKRFQTIHADQEKFPSSHFNVTSDFPAHDRNVKDLQF